MPTGVLSRQVLLLLHGRAMWPVSGLNEIMLEHHLAHSNCLLKNKCLPYGNDLCQKSEETLPNSMLLQSA